MQVAAAVGLVIVGGQITLFGPLAWPPVRWAITVALGRRPDQLVQLPRQHGRPLGGRRPDRRPAVRRGPGGRWGACSCRRSCWCWRGRWPGSWSTTAAPARLFMGDAGSNFLGFMLGSADGRRHVHEGRDRPGSTVSPLGAIAPLLVMAVPLYDTVSVIADPLARGPEPVPGGSEPLLAPAGRARVDPALGGADDLSGDARRRARGVAAAPARRPWGGLVVLCRRSACSASWRSWRSRGRGRRPPDRSDPSATSRGDRATMASRAGKHGQSSQVRERGRSDRAIRRRLDDAAMLGAPAPHGWPSA